MSVVYATLYLVNPTVIVSHGAAADMLLANLSTLVGLWGYGEAVARKRWPALGWA